MEEGGIKGVGSHMLRETGTGHTMISGVTVGGGRGGARSQGSTGDSIVYLWLGFPVRAEGCYNWQLGGGADPPKFRKSWGRF